MIGRRPDRHQLAKMVAFINPSEGNHAWAYFADAITESLTSDLSRFPGAFVIARNTALSAPSLLRVDIGAQQRVHSREMTLALGFEPIDHVAVEAQMHRGLSRKRRDARVFPEILSERRSFPGVLAPLILPARVWPRSR